VGLTHFLGMAGFALAVPAFAWLAAFAYVYTQPLDRPVNLDEQRRYMVAGGIIGAIIAVAGWNTILTTAANPIW